MTVAASVQTKFWSTGEREYAISCCNQDIGSHVQGIHMCPCEENVAVSCLVGPTLRAVDRCLNDVPIAFVVPRRLQTVVRVPPPAQNGRISMGSTWALTNRHERTTSASHSLDRQPAIGSTKAS